MAGETATPTAEFDATTAAVALGGAALLGAYAAWVAADFLPRWLTFGLVALVAGYRLFDQPTHRARARYAAYVLAGLLLLTPVLVVLPDALHADRMGVGTLRLVATTANAILFAVFALLAALVALAGRRAGRQ